MKNSILKSIFKGEFLMCERRRVYTEEEKALLRQIQDEENYFKSILSEQDLKRFESFLLLIVEQESNELNAQSFENFVIGMSVGLEIRDISQNLVEKD
ncbi:MAG: hypothetical protein R3Y12_05250 [Clostridia bacterium]